MNRRVTSQDLLFVSKSPRKHIKMLRAGISLEHRTGYTISEITGRVVADRLRLAKNTLEAADQAATELNQNRMSIGRSYYAMYHAMRAVVFFVTDGDDYEEHMKLPIKVPSDFPTRTKWQNSLREARYARNRADYDPYPKKDASFKAEATDLRAEARELLKISRQYLKCKGCPL